ncbi:MAG: hypothetical protein AAF502_09655 [Bacteroidota bacterium]
MNPIVKNILAVVAGVLVGWAVNMGLIMLGVTVVPPPEGADVTTPEGFKAAIPLFTPKNYIFPFLAHAIGTLAGAFATAKIAASNKMPLALMIGGLFMIGGIMMVVQLPAPLWFEALDLIMAYFPMGYLGYYLAKGKGDNN